jgi:hypothetical protein
MGEHADREPALRTGALADSCCREGKPPTFVVASLTRCCVAASIFEDIALQTLCRSVGVQLPELLRCSSAHDIF